ncbi:hypothetical protein MMPV_002976 [Pyropia vietnamensis]
MDLSRFVCGRNRRLRSDGGVITAPAVAAAAAAPASGAAAAVPPPPLPPPLHPRKRLRPSSRPASAVRPTSPLSTARAIAGTTPALTTSSATPAVGTTSATPAAETASAAADSLETHTTSPPAALAYPPAGGGAGWREKYATSGHPERPLRLLLVGHNPSDASWAAGHGYAHGGNRLWRLLRDAGVVPPPLAAAACDVELPAAVGVGLTDVWLKPGSDAAAVRRAAVGTGYREEFFGRLARHAARAAAVAAAEAEAEANAEPNAEELVSAGVNGGDGHTAAGNEGTCTAGEPAFVAFTGKSHFLALFASAQRVKTVPFGEQAVLPTGWPFRTSRVWVLPSSSGRAALTDADRSAPYMALGRALAPLPWPRKVAGQAGDGGGEGTV